MRPRIVLITDPRYEDDVLVSKLEQALGLAPSGLVMVQLRDKLREAGRLLDVGRRLRSLCREHGALFVVNDRLDVALALEADGVHLGRASVAVADARRLVGEQAFISVATHSRDELREAIDEGADAALLSPIFPTPGKGEPLGTEALRHAKAMAPAFPIYALGGIDLENARECLEAGASGVAMIRAFFDAEDPARSMRHLLDVLA